MTRIIAGTAGGRRLRVPKGRVVRPTTDRSREAIFSALGSRAPLQGATVLDAFAGSGALGLEALSRGAARAVFVERNATCREVLRSNVSALGFEDRAEVVCANVLGWLERLRGDSDCDNDEAGAACIYDVAFCDPPYSFADWDRLMEILPALVLVAESDRPVAGNPEAGDEKSKTRWRVTYEKKVGRTVVQLATRVFDQA